MRIEQAAYEWLASLQVAPSTLLDYESVVHIHIIPLWGKRKAHRLTREQVVLGLDGVSPGRRARVKTVLRRVVAQAGAEPSSVNSIRLASQHKPARLTVPNLDDVGRMAEAIGYYADLVWFAAGSGLRWGEIAALEPSDCERDVVSVTKSWCIRSSQLKEPKSRAGIRRVLVHPIGLEALSHRTALGTVPLFVTENQGARLHHSNFATEWRRAKRVTGLSWRFHDLRHTYATLLIEEGVGSVALAAMLGHSKPSVTYDIYAGFFKDPIETVRKELGR
jgi:integrase